MSLQTEIVGLAVAYVVLGALLLIAVTRARLPWPVKAGAVAATSAFYIFAFFRMQGFLGWPATADLPPRFELLSARVVDRDLVSNEAGAIHLWVAELDDANLPSRTPRAFVLPYSAKLAEKVEKAQAEITRGHRQFAKPWDYTGGQGVDTADGLVPARGGGGIGGDPSGGGILDLKFLTGGGPTINFAPLPPPRLPPKDDP
jgi:hypothetical protein